MKRGKLGFLLIILVLVVSLVSAGVFDSLKNIFTGKASSGEQNVSVSVVGIHPVSIGIYPISDVSPNEEGVRTLTFYAWVNDSDGVSDIDDASVSSEVSRGATSKISACNWNNDIDTKSANYSCSVNMWYWEEAGLWDVRVQAKDIGNGTMMNGSSNFTYVLSQAMKISPLILNWAPLVQSAVDQKANGPTIINNTGNYNGPVSVKAFDLKGEIINTESITSSAFTVGPVLGSECTATPLVNGSAESIAESNSNPGNLSFGGGAGQEQIYYCIPLVPSISSQIYSTLKGGSWVIGY